MKNLSLNILVLIFFLPLVSFAQTNKGVILTGHLHNDSKIILDNYQEQQTVFSDDVPGEKTPILAGLMSVVIPGAGQIYNEDYWIGAIFLAAEATLIYVGLTYDKKGDDQTTSFEKYADQNWSVVDYAEWLNTYENADITIDPDETKPPWERVNWSELNAAETGSHHLPLHGEQQYYELIGKYHQYSPGWNDYTGGANHDLVSPNLLYYSGERGKANDFYSTAKTAVIGIYINHFISALEAVWGATRFNKDIALNVRVNTINIANQSEFVPTLNFRYSF